MERRRHMDLRRLAKRSQRRIFRHRLDRFRQRRRKLGHCDVFDSCHAPTSDLERLAERIERDSIECTGANDAEEIVT